MQNSLIKSIKCKCNPNPFAQKWQKYCIIGIKDYVSYISNKQSIIMLSGQALVGLCEGLMDQTTRQVKGDIFYIKEHYIMMLYMQG